MADLTFENALKAMKIAHDQGNIQAARQMAQLAKSLQQSAEVEKAQSENDGFMAQVNKNIAEGVGGLVDFVNPFDEYTGSAATGLKNVMEMGGIKVAQDAPEGFVENLGAGIGSAASAVIPVGAGAKALQGAQGIVGQVARAIAPQMATTGGVAAELVAGGASQAASGAAKEAGYGETAQQIVGLGAGLGVGAIPMAARAAVTKSPVARGIGAAVAPFTQAGGRQIASQRMQELAGGAGRAAEVAKKIKPNTELGLSPAAQTSEPKLLQLEREAMRRDPKVAEKINTQRFESEIAARDALEVQGDVAETQAFIQDRQNKFADTIDNYIASARASAKQKIPTSGMDEIEASTIVSNELRGAEQLAKQQQRKLWGAIPQATSIDVSEARNYARSLKKELTKYNKTDLPYEIQKFISATKKEPEQTVKELNSLYSTLRDTARNASSGDRVNRNKARIANEMADEILNALDGYGGAIGEARDFSRIMHQKFSQGTVGDLLKRSVRGDYQVAPEVALSKTVGRGGAEGFVAQRDIANALADAPDSGKAINATANYLRNKFNETAFTADRYSEASAANFLKRNNALLDKFPDVRREIDEAIAAQSKVKTAEARGAELASALKSGVTSKFVQSNPDAAIQKVLQSQNPEKSMSLIVATAKKDPTGKAMDGLKKAVSDLIMSKSFKQIQAPRPVGDLTSELRGTSMAEALDDKFISAIANKVYSTAEMNRLKVIAKELQSLDSARLLSETGTPLEEFKPNVITATIGRVLGARLGAQFGGGMAGGLQSAQIGSSRVQQFLSKITNDKAQQMLQDAVTDPELFKALLLNVNVPNNFGRIEKTLAPYIVGAVAGQDKEQ
jgi:hypothetical protein